jgi:hypothetical protein
MASEPKPPFDPRGSFPSAKIGACSPWKQSARSRRPASSGLVDVIFPDIVEDWLVPVFSKLPNLRPQNGRTALKLENRALDDQLFGRHAKRRLASESGESKP